MADSDIMEMDAICRMETHTKTYCVKIERYSLIKVLKEGKSIEISSFHLAGNRWGIHFYPNGSWSGTDFIALHLVLLTEPSTELVIQFEYNLFASKGNSIGTMKSSYCTYSERGKNFGFSEFMKRTDVEASEYLKDDCLTVKLHLSVIKPFFVDATRKEITVPSSDLHQHFGGLLESGEGADVTFEIDEEVFSAHRNVLAARSPVFKAQLFGSMMESKMDKIMIEDMSGEVFKIMLQFIYTDMLPPKVEVSVGMVQNLLVAADRYGLERLKMICEKKLCDSLVVETVATTLLLANQHNCGQLKDVCIDFVASSDAVGAVMETDGFKHLMSCSPLLLKDILDKVLSSRKI
ncbi:hypothetical protein LUZ63_014339 [Rhynchospora breviuscula]|uniref:Uncharacterized protein n=1 Tax=Rhynchospora breviuscula TaxID=2022672 RepID=A0A9Q0CAR7_9POAL|nr:hypothetical protein LUZ63_014339 [Rhynchospora breviuscula]